MLRKLLVSLLLSSASLYATSETVQTTEVTEDPWTQSHEFDGVMNELHDSGAFREHQPKRYSWLQIKLMRMGANMYLYYHLCTKKVVTFLSYFKSKPKVAKKAVPHTAVTEN